MRTGIFRVMAVHAVGYIDFSVARRECRMMADNAASGARRAKLMLREDARREAEAFVLDISEDARLAEARATYADIVAELEDNFSLGSPSNPRRDYIRFELAQAARVGKVPVARYEADKDRLFGVVCDYCGDRGCDLQCVEEDDEFDY